MLGDQCVDDLVESFAFDDLRQFVQREIDSMIGDATLRIIVSADAFRAVTRTDLATPLGRARGIVIAFDLFLCCDRSSCTNTTIPLGMCVMRMADSVLLTCCPPAPCARMVSILRSDSLI